MIRLTDRDRQAHLITKGCWILCVNDRENRKFYFNVRRVEFRSYALVVFGKSYDKDRKIDNDESNTTIFSNSDKLEGWRDYLVDFKKIVADII